MRVFLVFFLIFLVISNLLWLITTHLELFSSSHALTEVHRKFKKTHSVAIIVYIHITLKVFPSVCNLFSQFSWAEIASQKPFLTVNLDNCINKVLFIPFFTCHFSEKFKEQRKCTSGKLTKCIIAFIAVTDRHSILYIVGQ